MREWVGTVTGKGDRWGRTVRQVCTRLSGCPHDCTPPHLTARQKASRRRLQLLFLLQGRPPAGCLFHQGLCRTESPLAVSACSACSAGCVPAAIFACHFAFVMPTALINILPPFSLLCPVQFIFALFAHLSIPCAPGSSFRKPTCLQAARLSRRQQQRGPAVAARAPCVSVTPLPVLQHCLQAAAPWRLHLGSPCAVVRHP